MPAFLSLARSSLAGSTATCEQAPLVHLSASLNSLELATVIDKQKAPGLPSNRTEGHNGAGSTDFRRVVAKEA